MAGRAAALVLVALATLVALSNGYYVPGTYPQEFLPGAVVQAQVNSLTSFETDMPYEYYSMPFCKPPEGVHRAGNAANLGSVLMGVRLETSPYNFTMMRQEKGKVVCHPQGSYGPLTKDDVEKFKMLIDNRYRINMVLDNLPVTAQDLLDEEQDFVRPGFELGFKEGDKYFIKNHLQFNVLVHPTHGEYMRARESLRDAAVLDSIDARRRAASRRVLLEHSSSSSSGRALASDAADAKAAQAASQQEAAAAGKGADGSDVK